MGPFYKSGSKYLIQFTFTQDFPGVMPNEIINDDHRAWPASLSQSVKRRESFCFSAHLTQVLIRADLLQFSAALNHMCCNNQAGEVEGIHSPTKHREFIFAFLSTPEQQQQKCREHLEQK